MIAKNREVVILALLIVLAFGVRIYKVTFSPEGLYIDETSIGYNAYSLLTTGKDEHGVSWPLFFEAFGEWKLPVYIYAVWLTQIFLGPSDLSVRLPAVLFGSFSVVLMYLWVKEFLNRTSLDRNVATLTSQRKRNFLFFKEACHQTDPDLKNKTVNLTPAFLAGFLLAISPWHYQFTHTGFEASAAIFFILLGLWLFFRAINYKTGLTLNFSILAFISALYSYNSARIVVPGLLFLLVILFYRSFKFWEWLKAALIFLLTSWPFMLFSISPAGWVRARQASIFFSNTSNPMAVFLINYWQNISPMTLFFRGEPTIAHLTIYRWGLMYLVELPLFFLGLINLLWRRNRLTACILGFTIIGFIPPAIGNLSPHALRGSLVIPAVIFISVWGFTVLQKNIKHQTGVLAIYIIILWFSLFNFLNTYHNYYTVHAGWDWQIGIKRATKQIKKLQNTVSDIYINNRNWGATTIAFLWYLQFPPIELHNAADKNNLGKYHFEAKTSSAIPSNSVYVGAEAYFANDPQFKLVDTIYYPDGAVAFYIWGN